jgi:hypothetical protein
MTRPAVFIDASSPLKRRLTLAGAAGGAVAVVIWWAMTLATAEHAPSVQPAKAQWAGSASPFAAVSVGATTPVVPATEHAAAVTPTPPPAAAPAAAPAAPPAATFGALGLHATPMSAPTGLAGARGGPETPDTEAEN